MTFVLLLFMIFCHVFDDYVLQGCLASLKQRSYWLEKAPDELYKHDYIAALLCHAFSWTFMIMLPILIHFNLDPPVAYYAMFPINWAIHAFVDDLKANRKMINLIQDQSIHLVQIIVTFGVFALT